MIEIKRTYLEDHLQASIKAAADVLIRDGLCFAIPNGGLRTKAEAAKLKWTGVVAGIPDMCLVLPDGRSLWMEMKTRAGRLSPAQEEVHKVFGHLGHPVSLIRSLDDFLDELRRLGVKTREAAHG